MKFGRWCRYDRPRFFIQNFKNTKKEKIIQFVRVDPNYTEGHAIITKEQFEQAQRRPELHRGSPSLDFRRGNGRKWQSIPVFVQFTPQPNDRVMVVKGVVVEKIV